jgi:hypothetical protein
VRSGCSLRCVQGNNDANPGSGVFGRLISKDGGAGEMLYSVTSALNQVTFFTVIALLHVCALGFSVGFHWPRQQVRRAVTR